MKFQKTSRMANKVYKSISCEVRIIKGQEQILSFSHGGDKRDRTAELLRNAAKAASGGKILIKNIQVVSGSKAGKKKKTRKPLSLQAFHMVEISGIEPLTS